MSIKKFLLLIAWITVLLSIGSAIGFLTKENIDPWYMSLNRSSLSPPNHLFGIAWSILYAMIAISGWLIWQAQDFSRLVSIKKIYIVQLLLNWSWTPLFFYYHQTGLALAVILMIIVLVASLIMLSLSKLRATAWLMTPYLIWSAFACYLNFYIWLYN